MSVQHLAWALEQRTGSVSRKVVLLALANRVNGDTGLCCPSVKTIMAETELGRATVFRCLEALEEQGLIERVERTRGNGSRTSSDYRFPSVTVIRGGSQNGTGEGVTVRPPEPEVRTGSRTSIAATPREDVIRKIANGKDDPRIKPNKADRDRIWDALTDIFGPVTTRTSETLRGKHVTELAAARATPDEILRRAKAWPAHFDSATLTAPALVKHWDTLGRKPLRRR